MLYYGWDKGQKVYSKFENSGDIVLRVAGMGREEKTNG